MGGSYGPSGLTFRDVLDHALALEEEYGVRIRLSCVPLTRKSGKSTHAILVTPYYLNGRRLAEVDAEQALWPGGTSKTREGAEFYLLTRMASALDEWAARKRREEEQFEPGRLTPLEEYIAGYSPS